MRIDVIQRPPAKGDLVHFHVEGTARIPGVTRAEFDGKRFSHVVQRDGTRRVLHVGLGKGATVKTDILRQAAGVAAKWLVRSGAEEISYNLETWAAEAQAVVEGALLAAYKFEKYRPPEARRRNQLRQVHLLTTPAHRDEVRRHVETGRILAEATNLTRAIGDEPGNVVTPAVLADHAKALAARLKIKCRVWDEAALRRGRFGGILAVGQGSSNPPRLIVLEMSRGPKSVAPVVVIGKAITFDSGGISIKSGDRMDEMKFDKMGGCAVLGIMQAVAELRLPINLVGVIPSAENMPSAKAYRPGDLIKSWDGKVIEVLNTDAEGRVVLADALAYARETYRPRLMIDLATLTGACVVALGVRRAGLFTSRKEVRDRLWELGAETGELVWPLPMEDEFDDQIKSDIALVKNTGGREGGACTGATFLRHWVGDIPWVHLDIAGPAWTKMEFPSLEAGATGFGVRLLTEYLRGLSEPRVPSLNGKHGRRIEKGTSKVRE